MAAQPEGEVRWIGALSATATGHGVAVFDLLDISAGASELAVTLKWAGKGLAKAFEGETDLPRARLVALRTLRRAQEDLAILIADLEGLVATAGEGEGG